MFLIKTDINGDTLWSKTYYNDGQNADIAYCVNETIDGGFVIAGYGKGDLDDDAILMKTDNNGNIVWSKSFGNENTDKFYAVNQTSDGGFICTGYMDGCKAYLVKTNPDGMIITSNNVEYNHTLVTEFKLFQNYPNPFNPSTKIKYELPKSSNVKIVIYNSLGKEIKILVNKYNSAGRYKVEFDASNFSSGIYFYKLQAGDFIETKKLILMK